MKKSSFAATVALALVLAGCSGNGPDENIALNKAAYASSTYDYNLTAQLVTDGVVESGEPAWLKVSTPEGELPRREKEWTVDAGPYSRNTLEGYSTFLEYEWGRQSFTASCVRIRGYVVYQNLALNGQFLAALQAPVRISVRSDSSEDPGCRDRRAIPR